MKQELNAYVPEIDFTNEKALIPLRTHCEDISVINPADQFRILAHRPCLVGKDLTLPTLWAIPAEELVFLNTALSSHSRIALFADGHAVLILGELHDASGVLLAVRPRISPTALRRYADTCCLGDLVFSPAFPLPATSLSDEELEQMDELNYYLGQILKPRGEVGLATLTWRVANFVGCRLEHIDLPVEEPLLAEAQIKRLTAYLLCVFLHLHTLGGDVSATDVTADTPQFRCRVEYVDPNAAPSNDRLLQLASLDFHKLPAFSDFVIRRQEERLILDAHLPLSLKEKSFHASVPSLFVLRLTLEKI